MSRSLPASQKPSRSDGWRTRLIPLLILLVTLAVYAPALWNGFVWDDTALVLRDPFIRSWRLIPEGFGHFLFTDATASDFYRPMQRLLFTFDYAVFAFAPWGYHLMSIQLQAAAGIALWELLREFTGRDRRGSLRAGVASILWVIHPLHTSAVTYVAGSADLLAALFGFTALKLMRVARRGDSLMFGGWAAIGFLAAMLSKESGAMFLPIGLIWLAWDRKWRRLLGGIGMGLVVMAVYLLCRVNAVHESAPSFSPAPSPAERPWQIVQAIGEYARLAGAPIDLHMERTLATGTVGVLQGGAGILVVVGFCWWLRRSRRRGWGAGPLLGAMALAFLPISNIFALNAPIAEHWLYVPMAFLLGALAVSSASVHSRVPALILAGWAIFLGGRTFVRNFDWRDQRTFVERTIEAGGGSARMWMTLSQVEMRSDDLPKARAAAERALAIKPDHPFGLLQLASVAIVEGNYDEARKILEKLKSETFFASERLVNLAAIARAEQSPNYLALLQTAADGKPENWSLQKRFVLALAGLGQREKARERLQNVIERQPYRAEGWALLGGMLESEGLIELARDASHEAALRDVHWSQEVLK